tara:strand:+ start:646 stop:828 length:183 start_codon:yes stop_codon:yes gene_type:complete
MDSGTYALEIEEVFYNCETTEEGMLRGAEKDDGKYKAGYVLQVSTYWECRKSCEEQQGSE